MALSKCFIVFLSVFLAIGGGSFAATPVDEGGCKFAGGNYYSSGMGQCEIIIPGQDDLYLSSKEEVDKYVAEQLANQPQASPSPSMGGTDGDPCLTANTQIQECVESAKTAVESSCNPQANSQMTSVMGMAKTMTNQASMATAASIEAACSSMGDLASKANAALIVFEGYCQIAETECTTACDQATAMVKSYKARCLPPSLVVIDDSGLAKAKRDCAKASNSLADAGVQIQNMMAQKMNAQQCANLAGNGMTAYCKSNPTSPLCVNSGANVNCSDPAVAASNTVCICNANPRDPRCSQAGFAAAGVNTASPSGSGSSSSASSKLAGGNPSFGLGGGADGGDGFGAGLTGTAPGGAGGGGPGGRGASRNINGAGGEAPHTAGAKGQAGGGGNGFNTKINGGYYGGSGGGGGFGGGSGSSGSGAGGYNRGGYAGGPGGAGYGAQAKVDLRQFLPGGKLDPSRGLAGVAGPDGITGPNSDIWQKVNNRYQAVSNSLKH